MTLKEKFYPYCDNEFQDKEQNAENCVDVAYEFAIGFAEWYEYQLITKGLFGMMDRPKKEILEKYKKEKGL